MMIHPNNSHMIRGISPAAAPVVQLQVSPQMMRARNSALMEETESACNDDQFSRMLASASNNAVRNGNRQTKVFTNYDPFNVRSTSRSPARDAQSCVDTPSMRYIQHLEKEVADFSVQQSQSCKLLYCVTMGKEVAELLVEERTRRGDLCALAQSEREGALTAFYLRLLRSQENMWRERCQQEERRAAVAEHQVTRSERDGLLKNQEQRHSSTSSDSIFSLLQENNRKIELLVESMPGRVQALLSSADVGAAPPAATAAAARLQAAAPPQLLDMHLPTNAVEQLQEIVRTALAEHRTKSPLVSQTQQQPPPLPAATTSPNLTARHTSLLSMKANMICEHAMDCFLSAQMDKVKLSFDEILSSSRHHERTLQQRWEKAFNEKCAEVLSLRAELQRAHEAAASASARNAAAANDGLTPPQVNLPGSKSLPSLADSARSSYDQFSAPYIPAGLGKHAVRAPSKQSIEDMRKDALRAGARPADCPPPAETTKNTTDSPATFNDSCTPSKITNASPAIISFVDQNVRTPSRKPLAFDHSLSLSATDEKLHLSIAAAAAAATLTTPEALKRSSSLLKSNESVAARTTGIRTFVRSASSTSSSSLSPSSSPVAARRAAPITTKAATAAASSTNTMQIKVAPVRKAPLNLSSDSDAATPPSKIPAVRKAPIRLSSSSDSDSSKATPSIAIRKAPKEEPPAKPVVRKAPTVLGSDSEDDSSDLSIPKATAIRSAPVVGGGVEKKPTVVSALVHRSHAFDDSDDDDATNTTQSRPAAAAPKPRVTPKAVVLSPDDSLTISGGTKNQSAPSKALARKGRLSSFDDDDGNEEDTASNVRMPIKKSVVESKPSSSRAPSVSDSSALKVKLPW